MGKVGLHRCANGHYHFLVGAEDHGLWPFWSLEEGNRILDHYEEHLPGKAIILGQLREMLVQESRKQAIVNGHFGKLLLPKITQPTDPVVEPRDWFDFVGGKRRQLNGLVWGATTDSGRYLPIGPFIVPVECDFCERPGLSRLKKLPDLDRSLKARAYPRPLDAVI